jgi:type III secretory pathway lipoprotein EscJ
MERPRVDVVAEQRMRRMLRIEEGIIVAKNSALVEEDVGPSQEMK